LTTAIDTNILLDLLTPGAPFAEASFKAIDVASNKGALVISEAVYAELSSKFLDEVSLDEFLMSSEIHLVATSRRALYLAGAKWVSYARTRPQGLVCNRCGAQTQARCERCNAPITLRQRVLSDFLIGAHALIQAERLLTRDRGIYGAHFPDLELV